MSSCGNGYYDSIVDINGNFLVNTTNNSTSSLNSTEILRNCLKCENMCANCNIRKDNCTKCDNGYLLLITKADLILINKTIYNKEINYLYLIFLSTNNSTISTSTIAGTCLTICPSSYFYPN